MRRITTLFGILILLVNCSLNAQVSINTDGSSADSSAILEIKSTDKGFLPPRMTQAQRDSISSPATGLIIYQTDSTAGLYQYDGISWSAIGSSTSSSHYIGELYGGGVVFWIDHTGEHGLIASLDDLDEGAGVQWGLYNIDVPNCESMTDGYSNTQSIIDAGATTGTAAVLCDNYTGGGYTDWYLPSNRELFLLASQDILIDQILDNDGDPNTNGFSQEYFEPTFGRYWSSTENEDNDKYYSWTHNFYGGVNGYSPKNSNSRVRAVRSF